MPATPLSSNRRRHDLDALRASAMLLGIGFHIAHSLAVGFPWFVQDVNQSKGPLILMYWVHGFRMPLFFILSGFFTAMMWRRRGFGAMIGHRFRRVFLPLVLMCFTVVPASNWAIRYAFSVPRSKPVVNSSPLNVVVKNFWTAIQQGDPSSLTRFLDEGADLSELHPELGTTPLSTAALFGQDAIVKILLENGADLEQKNKDSTTALHSAAFLGRVTIADILLEAGIDAEATNTRGETAKESALAPWEVTEWVVNTFSIPFDRGTVAEGRKRILNTLEGGENPRAAASVWAAIEQSDLHKLQAALDQGIEFAELHPESGMSALAYAAIRGETECVQLLLNAGANPNQRNRDKRGALHGAAFLGQTASAAALIEGGVDLEILGPDADMAADAARAPMDFAVFIAEQMQIDLEREAIRKGRAEVLALMAENGFTPKAQPFSLRLWLAKIGFSSFVHLWFLWYLCLLAVGFVLYAVVAKWIVRGRVSSAWVCSPLAVVLFIGLTMIPQYQMGRPFDFFGPDTSSDFVPNWVILGYYAIFFFFGAFYYDADDQKGRLGRYWPWVLAFGMLILFPAGLSTSGLALSAYSESIPEATRWGLGVAFKAAFAWAMSIGFIGLFRAVITRESRRIRYISDSSYWLYVIHFPIVILVQVWMQDWALGAWTKFTLSTAVITVLLLASYHLFVRYTPIGWMLNGKRQRPSHSDSAGSRP